MNRLSIFAVNLLLFASVVFTQPIVISDLMDSSIFCDYLIITPEQFLNQSVILAEHRNDFEGDSVLNAHVAVLENVYSTFGLDSLNNTEKLWFGLKWMYEHWQQPFTYVVLMGDDLMLINDTDTSVTSVGRMPSFIYDVRIYNNNLTFKTSDDAYTMLQEPYPMYSGDYQLPLYIGRIPCERNDQCQWYIEKVIEFDTTNLQGKWRNTVIFAADDEVCSQGQDFVKHWASCELISEKETPGYFIRKCYLSTFTKDSLGIHSDATNFYFNTLNQGALWSVFFGQGNEEKLTGEQFLRIDHVMNFDNKTQPTIFLAFTSSNGKYYNTDKHSMLKQYLFFPSKGCLAYIAHTFAAFSSASTSKAMYFFSFARKHQNLSLGKIFRMAKETGTEDGGYHLFGDPALIVAKPSAPLTCTLIISNTDNDTLRCVFSTPISSMSNFAYEITIPESTTVNQYGFTDVNFINHIPVKDSTGEFDSTFDIPIPGTKQDVPLHITVYTWNYAYEARKDTTLYFDSITSIQKEINTNLINSNNFIVSNNNNLISIRYTLPHSSNVKLEAFDIKGKLVKKIVDKFMHKGSYSVNWDSKRYASGIYYLKLSVGNNSLIQKAVMIK